MIVMEFSSLSEAEACLTAINALAATYWTEQGYTVVEADGHKELVGKNAATGEDMPDSARTITWDEVRASPDGTFYFASLSNDPRFAAGLARLTGFAFTERPLPEAWTASA